MKLKNEKKQLVTYTGSYRSFSEDMSLENNIISITIIIIIVIIIITIVIIKLSLP